MGACLKHTPLLQEILHVEGLHENAAQRLHKTMKGDAAGVTFENLVVFMASVVKVSCRGPTMTYLHHSALSKRKHGDRVSACVQAGSHAYMHTVMGPVACRGLQRWRLISHMSS